MFRALVLIGTIVMFACRAYPAPQALMETAVESPHLTYAANVEWDDAGFIGRIKMLIYTRGVNPTATVELPQMNPSPANLTWINEVWVACESFIAEQGAAFFYMDVPRSKGYLIEIMAPEEREDWIISFTTNDSISSDSVSVLSSGRSSLFPILMRDLPENGDAYVTTDFAFLLADAVDGFTQWRKNQKFKNLSFISKPAESEKLGQLVLGDFDGSAEIIYYPQGTTTTREMLALTKRQKLPETVQNIIVGIDPPDVSVKWTDDNGGFQVVASRDNASSTTVLVEGKFEGVKDKAYAGPGIDKLIIIPDRSNEEAKAPEPAKSSSSKSKSKSKPAPKTSSKKRPSRSK